MCVCACVRQQTDETTDRHPQHAKFPLKIAYNTEHTVSDLLQAYRNTAPTMQYNTLYHKLH